MIAGAYRETAAAKTGRLRFNSLILGLRDIKCENSKVKNSLQLPDSKVLSFSSLFVKSEFETVNNETNDFELHEYKIIDEAYNEFDFDLEYADLLLDFDSNFGENN